MDYNENIEPGVDVNVIKDGEHAEAPADMPRVVMQMPKYKRTEEGFIQVSPEDTEGKELIDLIDVGDMVNYQEVVSVDRTGEIPVITLDFFGTKSVINNSESMFTALAKEVRELWKKKIEDTFGKYQDYPTEGVLFEDINPVLRNTETLGILMELISLKVNTEKADYIVAPESRGFILGAFICGNLGKPLILARKPGKLPGEIVSATYKTEYSEDTLEMQKIDLTGKNVWFIDDVFATGGTYEAVRSLVEQNGGTLAGGTVVKSVLGKEPKEVQVVL